MVFELEQSEVVELIHKKLLEKGFKVEMEALKVVYESEGEWEDQRTVGFHVEVELNS